MADISITKYKTKVTKPTASPSNPGYPTSDPIDPVNPPASGVGGGGVNTFLQLTDTPSTYSGQAGLFPRVNSGETGLEFFNPLSSPLTGYTVGSNTALASTDTILGAFGKVQGQINAKIGGTIASGQVAVGTGVNTIGGSSLLTYNSSSLGIGSSINPFFNITSTGQSSTKVFSLFSKTLEDYNLAVGAVPGLVSGAVMHFTASITNSSNKASLISMSAETLSGGLTNIFFGALSGTTGNGAANFVIGRRTSVSTWVETARFDINGNLGINTNSPTNTLDVNGTARIRTLTGTTGYLPLLSSTGVMGQSVAYNADTGVVINGTFLPSGAVLSVNGVSFFNNFATAGAYDKLSIDFGENRGFGYDPTPNEIFIKGASTVPVKIDTDAPTDSFNILSTGGIKMANIPSGTPATALGLDSNNELVKSTAVSITSGTFTPVLTDTSAGATFTTTAVGKYYKVGNRVDVYISFDISAITGTATGDIEITDLPFSIDYGLNSSIHLMLNYSPPTSDRGVEYITPLLTTGTSFKLSYINGNGFVLAGTLASTSDIILTASYITT